MTDVTTLPAECLAEIETLQPFASHSAAVAAVNGPPGIRGKYERRLYAIARAQNLSDRLVANIGAAIGLACDRAVAITAPIVDANHGAHGWTGVPIDCLTQAEKEALQ